MPNKGHIFFAPFSRPQEIEITPFSQGGGDFFQVAKAGGSPVKLEPVKPTLFSKNTVFPFVKYNKGPIYLTGYL